MGKKHIGEGKVTRREFARGAMIAATVAALPPTTIGQEKPAEKPTPAPLKPPDSTPGAELSAPAKKEAELKVQWILDRYGERLSEEQRKDIRKYVLQTQESLEKLRAFPLENADEPATVLHLDTPVAGGR